MDKSSPEHKSLPEGITIRHNLRPGDMGALVRLHGILYAAEYGYDHTFEPYVAGPMAQFVLAGGQRQRIWIVERTDQIAGCLAVVEVSGDEAQLRWFLLDPKVRGLGLGRRLLGEALSFARQAGYQKAFLMTVDIHTEAARLYRSVGFQVTEEHQAVLWGGVLTEQRYEIRL
jgi:ribosomal protein S18 acetylase RimI-like enzyme